MNKLFDPKHLIFGDKLKTKSGSKAIFLCEDNDKDHILIAVQIDHYPYVLMLYYKIVDNILIEKNETECWEKFNIIDYWEDWIMDKAVLYSLLEQYIDNADKEQIVRDIKHAFTDRDIRILLEEAGYLHNC